MMIDISDKQVWATVKSLDIARQALELIQHNAPSLWARRVASDALLKITSNERGEQPDED
jgi:hypothetical protein